MIKGKRGWLRILEAFIAIMLIMSVLIIFLSNQSQEESSLEDDIFNVQRNILSQVVGDDVLRQEVLVGDKTGVEELVNLSVPYGFNFEVKICDLGVICSTTDYISTEVYAQEAIISSSIDSYNPKVLKLFFWKNS